MKTTVERLFEQEMRCMERKERSKLPLNIELFEKVDILKKEIELIQKKEALNALDTKRYELQGP
jgi:pre-mRNA-splicing factor SPF27